MAVEEACLIPRAAADQEINRNGHAHLIADSNDIVLDTQPCNLLEIVFMEHCASGVVRRVDQNQLCERTESLHTSSQASNVKQ